MSNKIKVVQRDIGDRFEEYSPKRPIIPALMGDGNDNVVVDGRPGFVYIRVGASQSLGQAFNNRLQPRDDLAIYVGYTDTQPDLLQVLDVRQQEYVAAGNSPIPIIPRHHETHEFNSADGSDVIWVEKQQLTEALTRPTDPESMNVYVHPILYAYAGSWEWFPGDESDDLSGYMPSNSGEARYVLIYIDTSTNALDYSQGEIFAELAPPVDMVSALPDAPAASIPVGAVYLTSSTTEITFDDNLHFDPRFTVTATGGVVDPGPHASTHEDGGSDEIDASKLAFPDTGADHDMFIDFGEDATADRTLTVILNDGDRQLTLESDAVLDQDLSEDGGPGWTTIGIITGVNELTLDTGVGNDYTLTLTVVGNYEVTFPEAMTVAGRDTAQEFTAAQEIDVSSATAFVVQDTAGGADSVFRVDTSATEVAVKADTVAITLGSGAGEDFSIDADAFVVTGDTEQVGVGTDAQSERNANASESTWSQCER